MKNLIQFCGKCLLAYGLTLTVGMGAHAASDHDISSAITAGDVAAVSSWIEQGGELEAVVAGETPLYRAAKAGQLAVVEQLLTAGAKVDTPVPGNRIPIMAATYYGHLDVVKRLLKAGADPEFDADSGYATFDFALESGQQAIMSLLLSGWLNHSQMSHQERDSLLLVRAVVDDQPSELTDHLVAGRSPDTHNRTGYAPLPLAIRLQRNDMVDLLLERGANPNIGNDGNDEALPLNQAARGGHLDLLNKVLAAGADANRGNERGYTALMLATSYQFPQLIAPLIAAGADPKAENQDGFTAMDYAIQRGSTEVTVELLQQWPMNDDEGLLRQRGLTIAAVEGDVDAFNDADAKVAGRPGPWGYSNLALAARFGHADMVKTMLMAGADVNRHGLTGYRTTPLIDASRLGDVEVGQLLLDHGAQVTDVDGHGDPAINWATFYGHLEFAKLLLAHGADPLQASDQDYTAVKTAEEQGHRALSELYAQHLPD
ncbi:MAG: hypothetical protein DHS20C11_11170 [Lysobacteraceae bacterium]|nr:MAG: hypothetical protein DHS20C11_11170 [Xanthomonadaceae bacterium]